MNLSPRLRWFVGFIAIVAFLGILAIGVFPVRDYMFQREETASVRSELAKVNAQNAEYEARITALLSDTEIERLARSDYNLVFPDEESYTVLPTPLTNSALPGPWPFVR